MSERTQKSSVERELAPFNRRATAELLVHVANLAQSRGYAHGLKPSQWTALRYFANAAAAQRTVSAFAAFHGTTRGAASQMVEVLVSKELLVREAVPEDRRVVRLVPTRKAHDLLAVDPIMEFAEVIGDLSPTQQHGLDEALGLIARRFKPK